MDSKQAIHSNRIGKLVSASIIAVLVIVAAYLLISRPAVAVGADSAATTALLVEVKALRKDIRAMEAQLSRIEDCACTGEAEARFISEPLSVFTVFTYTHVITEVVIIDTCVPTDTVIISDTVIVTDSTTITDTVITVTPTPDMPPPVTPPTTVTPTPEPPARPSEPTSTPEPKQHKDRCNQGVGNGPEGCSPGKSDNTVRPGHPQPPNDEKPENTPGNPERKGGNGKGNGPVAKAPKAPKGKGK